MKSIDKKRDKLKIIFKICFFYRTCISCIVNYELKIIKGNEPLDRVAFLKKKEKKLHRTFSTNQKHKCLCKQVKIKEAEKMPAALYGHH